MIAVVVIPFLVAVFVGFRIRSQQNEIFIRKNNEIDKLTGLTKKQQEQLQEEAKKLAQVQTA